MPTFNVGDRVIYLNTPKNPQYRYRPQAGDTGVVVGVSDPSDPDVCVTVRWEHPLALLSPSKQASYFASRLAHACMEDF